MGSTLPKKTNLYLAIGFTARVDPGAVGAEADMVRWKWEGVEMRQPVRE